MKNEIAYYGCLIMSQIWIATSRTAFTISPVHTTMGIIWFLFAMYYELS